MNAYEYLLSYHIKPSVQRIAIMDYLLKHHTHPRIDMSRYSYPIENNGLQYAQAFCRAWSCANVDHR